MTFKEDFKPTKVYNKLVNDVCYNADCLEEFEKQRLVVANPFSYNKSTRTGIVAEFDNGYHLSKEEDEGKDNGNNEDEGNKGNDNENEMKSYNESDSENDSNGNN